MSNVAEGESEERASPGSESRFPLRLPPGTAIASAADSLATLPAMVPAVAVRAVERLDLLERPARPDRDAGQRRLRAVRGHLRLVAQALVQALQERAAAGEHDPAVHDVRRELGRRAVEGLLDRVDDLHE